MKMCLNKEEQEEEDSKLKFSNVLMKKKEKKIQKNVAERLKNSCLKYPKANICVLFEHNFPYFFSIKINCSAPHFLRQLPQLHLRKLHGKIKSSSLLSLSICCNRKSKKIQKKNLPTIPQQKNTEKNCQIFTRDIYIYIAYYSCIKPDVKDESLK